MRYTFKNEDFTYDFDFKINDDFVSPDDGSYSYKVRSMDGTILLEGNVSIETEDDYGEEDTEEVVIDHSSFTIPAAINTMEGDLFDSRIVEISFRVDGKSYTLRDSYRITDFYYFTATPKDVRDYYGLNNGELTDDDIDLTEVYLQLVKKHGSVFTDSLKQAGVANLRANRLIVLKGVVQVFPSVRLRVNQEENDGSSKFLRYLNKINWDDLLDRALAEIEELEADLTGEGNVAYTEYNPFFLGAVRDAITGEDE